MPKYERNHQATLPETFLGFVCAECNTNLKNSEERRRFVESLAGDQAYVSEMLVDSIKNGGMLIARAKVRGCLPEEFVVGLGHVPAILEVLKQHFSAGADVS